MMTAGEDFGDWERVIIDAFHRLYYEVSIFDLAPAPGEQQASPILTWLGVPVSKCPPDLWIYQEIIYERKPELIVETGTQYGGSALFLANLLDFIGSGRVVTVDIRTYEGLPQHERVLVEHPRIEYLLGSSTSPEVVERIKALADGAERVMVILDSDHRMQHVLKELSIYSNIVTDDQYLIVEDTDINGHPVFENFGPGPMEALERFLAHDKRFVIDKSREKFLMTVLPNGYLLKAPSSEGIQDPLKSLQRRRRSLEAPLEEQVVQNPLMDVELQKAADYARLLLGEIKAKDAEIERLAGLTKKLEAELNRLS